MSQKVIWKVYFVTSSTATTVPAKSRKTRSNTKLPLSKSTHVPESNLCSLLTLAYECCSDFGDLETILLPANQVLTTFPTKPAPKYSYFILEDFKGEVFQHLLQLDARMLGPQVVLDYLRDSLPLVRWPVPLFSTALRGVTVTLTAIMGPDRDETFLRIQMLHGRASRNLDESVNVLIAPNVGSAKYYTAGAIGIPIVRPSWLEELWKLSTEQELVNGIDPALLQKHRLPIFDNMVIVVSGMEPEDKNEVKQVVELHGGRYSANMVIGECTHLLLREPIGNKFEYALKWRVPTVHPKWLVQCVEKGYALEEKDFLITKQSSSHQQMTTASSRPATTSSVLPQTVNRAHFFHGLKMALLGFTNVEARRWMDRIRAVGGQACSTVMDMVAQDVSHVVLNKTSNAIPDRLAALEDEENETNSGQRSGTAGPDAAAHYIWSTWLEACFEKKQVVDVTSYLAVSDSKGKKKNAKTSQPPSAQPLAESNKTGEDTTTATLAAVDEQELTLIQQYFTSLDMAKTGDDATSSTSATANATRYLKNEQFFLHPSLFPEDKSQLQEVLRSAVITGCRNMATAAVLPYLLLNEENDPTLKQLPDRCLRVTPAFVYQCCDEWREVDEDAVLHMERQCEDNLYQPVLLPSLDPLPLQGCVLSLSGFTGSRRNHLVRCCMYAGAVVQEFFSRVADPKKGVLPTTHLVSTTAEGRKYEASVQWKIPAVKESWIFASIQLGKRAPESEHSFSKADASANKTFKLKPADNVAMKMVSTAATAPLEAPTLSVTSSVQSESKVVTDSASDLIAPTLSAIATVKEGSTAVATAPLEVPTLSLTSSVKAEVTAVTFTSSDLATSLETSSLSTSSTTASSMPMSITSASFRGVQRNIRRRNIFDQNSEEFIDANTLSPHRTASENVSIPPKGTTPCVSSPRTGSKTGKISGELPLPPKDILMGHVKSTQNGPEVRWLYTDGVETSTNPPGSPTKTDNTTSTAVVSTESTVNVSSTAVASMRTEMKTTANSSTSSTTTTSKSTSSIFSFAAPRPPPPAPVPAVAPAIVPAVAPPPPPVQQTKVLPVRGSIQITRPGQKEMIFMFAGLPVEEKELCLQVIQRLGGVFLEDVEHLNRVTHLIIAMPIRSEKFITGLAKGIWILHASYISACKAANKWVDETEYEWGHPSTDKELVKVASDASRAQGARVDLAQLRDLASACTLWRQRGGNAFKNWNVVFSPKTLKEVSFRRLIEAGGGKVVATDAPYPLPSTVTHAFIEGRLAQMDSRPNNVPAGFHWMKYDYISEYLTKPQQVDIRRYYVNWNTKRPSDEAVADNGTKRSRV